jgi:hypothetical protein
MYYSLVKYFSFFYTSPLVSRLKEIRNRHRFQFSLMGSRVFLKAWYIFAHSIDVWIFFLTTLSATLTNSGPLPDTKAMSLLYTSPTVPYFLSP